MAKGAFRPGIRVTDEDGDTGVVLAAKKGGQAIYVQIDDGTTARYRPDQLRLIEEVAEPASRRSAVCSAPTQRFDDALASVDGAAQDFNNDWASPASAALAFEGVIETLVSETRLLSTASKQVENDSP
jgi:hypothetical protein